MSGGAVYAGRDLSSELPPGAVASEIGQAILDLARIASDHGREVDWETLQVERSRFPEMDGILLSANMIGD